MKKILPIIFFLIFLFLPFSPLVSAQVPLAPVQNTTVLPPEGSWILDPEVTKIGKNASRSGMLLDWTLRDYQWSYVQEGSTNPLVAFWQVIQRIVYALFLFVILVTAFILIVTRGKSLSAKKFLPRFFLVILLVTFSFSLIQFLYQIIDIFQGFFLRNSQGSIISSKDLLYIGWDYRNFQGIRQFGEAFEESAFISLILVKLTAFTYYVMAILLIVRKVILWFFIVLSPVFPLLLLFYPVRNTSKIWIGEFFRWLLYAPLFAIFLAGLVRVWQTSLPLLFNFSSANQQNEIIYPTAVNILLGGPRQNVSIINSVNLPDTFALYLVALIMLWVVIILPFILLQIFLDYMFATNFKDSPVYKQMMGLINNRFAPRTPAGTPPPVPGQPAGLARTIPIDRRFSVPRRTGLAKDIPTGQTITASVVRPTSTQTIKNTEIMRLTNVAMPTMRDIARFDTTRLSRDTANRQEVSRLRSVLERISNPASVSSSVERERARELRERLVTESRQGNQVATTLLNAAHTLSSQTSSVSSDIANSQSSQTQIFQNILQQLANPVTVTSTIEREKINNLKERIITESRRGNSLATTLLNSINSSTQAQTTNIQEGLQKLSKPQSISQPQEQKVYQELREKIITASKSGNSLASLVISSLESSNNERQISVIQEKLLQAQSQGSPLAAEILKTIQYNTSNTTINNKTINSFTEAIRRLSKPDLISETEEKQSYQNLREKIVASSKSGNELASLLVSAFDSTTSTEQIKNIQEKVIQASKEGSELAKEILSTVQNTSQLSEKVEVEKLQTKLEEAKKQGDPLAKVLLTMLSSRKATSKSPVKSMGKVSASHFPVVNRLQQVSLDDYEAVRKLWKENYQNLEVPQSLQGVRTRSAWINEDVSDIQQTISLLTSNNPEEVEDGMKKVSDILPFLLIGGFSQTEIVAYLKAKMEAGKSVLEEVNKLEAEEDTLLDVKRVNVSIPKTQQAAASATIDNSVENSYTVNNYTSTGSPVSEVNTSVSNNQSTIAPQVEQVLKLVNLSLPTIRDIVTYEKNSRSTDKTQSSSLQSVLSQIARPQSLTTPEEKERFQTLKTELERQSKNGNQLASNILSVAGSLGEQTKELNSEDSSVFLQTLRQAIDPSQSVSSEVEEYTKAHQTLSEARRQASNLALQVYSLVDKASLEETESVQSFLRKVANPEEIHTATERTLYTKLRERLGEASESHDQVALNILNAAKTEVENAEANKIRVQLLEAQSTGDTLASYIMTTLVSHPETTNTQIQNFYQQLVAEKQKGDQLASLLLRLLTKKQKKSGVRTPLSSLLPKQNRLQQVSLEDYEAVKKMWYENYINSEVPLSNSGKPQSREEWIEEEISDITTTLNLLSSDDSENISQGMERVSAILPFLLLGDFSQTEIVGYLKAKLEAAKMAQTKLKSEAETEELVTKDQGSEDKEKHLAAEVEPETMKEE